MKCKQGGDQGTLRQANCVTPTNGSMATNQMVAKQSQR